MLINQWCGQKGIRHLGKEVKNDQLEKLIYIYLGHKNMYPWISRMKEVSKILM